jgi:hypothetical protein
VDLENRPFRLEDGRLLFRPSGHGALIQNRRTPGKDPKEDLLIRGEAGRRD